MIAIVIAVGWVIISGVLLWLYTHPTPDIPDGVTISHDSVLSWNYHLTDPAPEAQWGIGYLTRASAIRAAQQELDRLAQRKPQA